jgi:hypothetical protein
MDRKQCGGICKGVEAMLERVADVDIKKRTPNG